MQMRFGIPLQTTCRTLPFPPVGFGGFGTKFGNFCRRGLTNRIRGLMLIFEGFCKFGNIFRSGHRIVPIQHMAPNLPNRRTHNRNYP